MDGLSRAHKLISLLVTPTDTPPGADVWTWFKQLIAAKNNEYISEVEGAMQLCGDPTFDFVRCCVNALVNLQLELVRAVEVQKNNEKSKDSEKSSDPVLEADALSITQQKNINSLLEMIVSLGILPNLIPGIGIQAEKRSDFLPDIIKHLPERKILEKYKQLIFSLDSLLGFSKHKALSTLIMTRHLGDLLCALIQVANAPLIKPKPSDTDTPASQTASSESSSSADPDMTVTDEDVFIMTEELYQRLASDQAKYGQELDRVVEKTYQPTIIKHLLSLQAAGGAGAEADKPKVKSTKTAPKVPRWFTKRVSELLSSRFLVSNGTGVSNVIRGVLDLGGGDLSETMDWKKIDMVAKLLASPPQGPYSTVEAYYKVICPQIIPLIDDKEDRLVQMIACTSFKTVSERSLILSRRYLHDPVMDPLLKLTNPSSKDEAILESLNSGQTSPPPPIDREMAALAVTEDQLDNCLKCLYKIFVIGNDPSLMFLANLEPIILVLIELHATIAYGVSHLVQPVKTIITRYLKHSNRPTAIAVLRCFALGVGVANSPGATGISRLREMNKDLCFVSGDDGGVKVGRVADTDKTFFLRDDEKSIAVQDLLDEMKDKQAGVDFFLTLMQDLTRIVTEDDEGEHEDEEQKQTDNEGIAFQLKDLESQLDKTMERMRRNLMVIRLLGLLSEDKELQDQLMSESKRMIEFIGTTIRRAAHKVRTKELNKQESNNPLGEDDESDDMLAVQSLNMALSILSLHLTQKDVKISDWEDMLEYSSDLETLSKHPDMRVSKISRQLNALVLTHGTVIAENKKIRENTKRIEEETEKMKQRTAEIKRVKKEIEDKQLDERKEQLKQKAEEIKRAKEERRKQHDSSKQSNADKFISDDTVAEMKILEDKSGMTLYQSAIYDVTDPLLPVRAHGIIQLGKLVEQKDQETLDHMEKVVKIFVSSLEDGDTYVYLSAINSLVSCGRYKTESVLDVLIREFASSDTRKQEMQKGDYSTMEDKERLMEEMMQLRTKVGEALVRLTKQLGELTPHYKNQLLNAFFSASNDPDEMVRASSLSNLGEVCKNLGWSLGSICGELMHHLEQSSRDQSVEVRRAAALVLTLTLQGLGRDALRILEASIRDIYRALRLRLSVEKDETALIHINLALDEIDKIVTELFTAAAVAHQQPEKRIYVLDTPPDA